MPYRFPLNPNLNPIDGSLDHSPGLLTLPGRAFNPRYNFMVSIKEFEMLTQYHLTIMNNLISIWGSKPFSAGDRLFGLYVTAGEMCHSRHDQRRTANANRRCFPKNHRPSLKQLGECPRSGIPDALIKCNA